MVSDGRACALDQIPFSRENVLYADGSVTTPEYIPLEDANRRMDTFAEVKINEGDVYFCRSNESQCEREREYLRKNALDAYGLGAGISQSAGDYARMLLCDPGDKTAKDLHDWISSLGKDPEELKTKVLEEILHSAR